jgi:hypothetical protein
MMHIPTALAGRCAMEWTAPKFVEIKMDAEIGSYQEDGEPTRESPIAEGETGDGTASAAS